MKTIQKGFTLIELMIVVAIIAILAAIAIPAYQDFATRSQVSEMMVVASACKNNIAEFYADKGRWPAVRATGVLNGEDGCSTSNTSKVLAPAILASGVVEVDANPLGPLAPKLGAASLLHMAPSDGVTPGTLVMPIPGTATEAIGEWICDATAGTTILTKFLPAQCR